MSCLTLLRVLVTPREKPGERFLVADGKNVRYTIGRKDGITIMASVKTAISIEESLFEKANELARKLKISRSQLFAKATAEYVRRHENKMLLERLNEVYADAPDAEERALCEEMMHLHQQGWKDPW